MKEWLKELELDDMIDLGFDEQKRLYSELLVKGDKEKVVSIDQTYFEIHNQLEIRILHTELEAKIFNLEIENENLRKQVEKLSHFDRYIK